MVSSVKLAELWQGLGYRVIVACMGESGSKVECRKSKDRSKVERQKSFDLGPSTKPSTFDFRHSTIEQVSETLEIHRIKDIFIPDPWNYGIAFGFTGYVRKLIKKEKPDIIVANKLLFWTTLSVIALRVTGIKVIVLTDALVGMTWWPRNLIPKICAAIYAWTAGWLILLCAKRVVFFHPQPESLVRKLGIAWRVEVIPTGIDLGSHWSLVTGHSSDDEGLATSDKRLVTLTYIGRLESVKGVDDFLAAVVPLKSEFPDIKIQVVGWYKEGHELVEKYQREVTFTGLRDDIPQILSESDIFVLPSYSEGLSNALMEAMASGCACIATEVGGNRFLIQNGISGLLFPPGDREALKAHIRRLIEDEAKRKMLGEAARKRIEEEFEWKVVGEKYGRLFDKFTTSASTGSQLRSNVI